jgi:CRISPR system Cascade subunit CasE
LSVYLAHVRLKHDAPVAAIAPILWPDDADARTSVAHRLIWSLFAGDPAAKRDFLWREEVPGGARRKGAFYVLSRQAPHDALGLFEMDTKMFEPRLIAGDRLGFVLRANPTVAVKRYAEPQQRGKRMDVVMAALLDAPKGERALARVRAVQEKGTDWLRRQGARAGFDIVESIVDGYRVRKIERNGGKAIQFAEVDIHGTLVVSEPAAFLTALLNGFGRAKSFGCGLMMIRRSYAGWVDGRCRVAGP